MKTFKFIFAFFLFATLLTSCSATSTSEDDELYSIEDVQAIGADGDSDIIRSRE